MPVVDRPVRLACPPFVVCVLALLLPAGLCSGLNLVQNPGFESGTANWFGFGPVTFTAPTTRPHTGSRSALIQNRTETWQGVAQSLLGSVQPGVPHSCSGWVRLISGGSQPVQFTFKKIDGSGTNYETFASGTATSTGWTQLSGTYTLNISGTLTDLTFYVQGPAAGVSFYADDFDMESTFAPVGAIQTTNVHQTIEGFGGATAFYANWLTAHPYKQEIYTNAFAGLNLSLLRLGNWFRYQGTVHFDPPAVDIVSNANRILGHSVPVLMSSWSPPAFLKSNGKTTDGGTLIVTNGGFAYTQFADYWYDSLMWYKTNGIVPAYISIQNEPDWAASWDTCILHPTEDTVNGTNYASYGLALDATFQRLANLPAPPKLLGPETAGIGYSSVQNYGAHMNADSFYGVAHHLYNGGTRGDADSFLNALQGLTNVFPGKPKFQTEYDETNAIQCALLIHHTLTTEQAGGYVHWSLVWPVGGSALVQQENPWSPGTWTNAPPGCPTQSHGYWLTPAYYAMKHFSYFISPGYQRVETPGSDPFTRLSAYVSPDQNRLVVVMIRPGSGGDNVTLALNGFAAGSSAVYQTAGANAEISQFAALGSAPANLEFALPANSITTVVFDAAPAMAGPASNPNPANGAFNVAVAPNLGWIAGSNAAAHRVYFGYDSNAVALAGTNSSEFKGSYAGTNFSPGLLASSGRFYWRVDELAGTNATGGAVWTFATLVDPAAGPEVNGSVSPTNTFVIRFNGQSGQRFRVDRSDSLSPANWVPVADGLAGAGALLEVIDPAVSPGQRFYRAVLLAP